MSDKQEPVEEPVDVMWTKVLKPLKPGLVVRNGEPLAIVRLFVGTQLNADAIEADGHLEQAVFCQVDKITPGNPPALFDFIQRVIILVDPSHPPSPRTSTFLFCFILLTTTNQSFLIHTIHNIRITRCDTPWPTG